MKLVFFALSLIFTISSFAAVHCDNNQGTELHSRREIIMGSKEFSDSEQCRFSALVANNANTGIACAPYTE